MNVSSSTQFFDFEVAYDPKGWRNWAYVPANRWLGLPIALLYVVAVFGAKAFMAKRSRGFDLKNLLVAWNFVLALFSWFGAWRMVPFFWEVVGNRGVDFSLCDDAVFRNPVTAFWIACFVWSKILELLDTAFIILRKQNLIFLHWYHHATVVILAFANWHAWPGIGLWQTTMNYSVHAVMYTYYMLRSMDVKPPVVVNKLITTIQIVQMIVACLLGGRSFYFMVSGQKCGTDTLFTSGLAFAFYFSYLILFVHFFVKTYLIRPAKRQIKEFSPTSKEKLN